MEESKQFWLEEFLALEQCNQYSKLVANAETGKVESIKAWQKKLNNEKWFLNRMECKAIDIFLDVGMYKFLQMCDWFLMIQRIKKGGRANMMGMGSSLSTPNNIFAQVHWNGTWYKLMLGLEKEVFEDIVHL